MQPPALYVEPLKTVTHIGLINNRYWAKYRRLFFFAYLDKLNN